jgi:membrane peptidoglycan carboxypeptidase
MHGRLEHHSTDGGYGQMSIRPGDRRLAGRVGIARATLRSRRRSGSSAWLGLVAATLVVLVAGLLLAGAGLTVAGAGAFQVLASPAVVDIARLSRASLPQTTRIYDRTGTHVLATIYTQDRDYVTYANIPPDLVNATVAIEDRGFWTNPGIDVPAIARAALNDVAGGPLQGGSTITEQLVKLLITGSQPTISRKIREALLGIQASRALTKQQVMELYLNAVYYGEQAYGVAAAARHYFDEPLARLTLGQAAMLAGLPKAPAALDPFVHPHQAVARQRQVLDAMVATGAISPAQRTAAERQPLGLERWSRPAPPVPWFTDRVIAEASRLMGGYDNLASCGCKVITTLDWGLQRIAQHDVTTFVAKLPPNLNVHNGALVAQDPATGQILAYVGSVDPADHSPKVQGQFDSAGVALRSPGSTWKLVTYLAAMEYGHLTDASTLWDIPIEFAPGYVGVDSEHDYNGLITVRQAIRESRNVPAIQAMLAYGGVPAMEKMAYRLGLTVPFAPGESGPSLAIGTHSVHLTDMVEMYSTESNLGLRVTQNDLLRIQKPDGSVVLPPAPTQTQVVSPGLAWEFLSVLQDNANRNRGWMDGPFADLGRPAAVKTGTEANFRDLYTVGMVPQMVAGVWLGNADNSPMNSAFQSNVGPLVLWHQFMSDAIKLKQWPAIDWPRPAELVPAQVCANFGEFAGYGFDVNGPGCPFGTTTSWVIPGFNDPATLLALRPKPFGTYLTDGQGHVLPSQCTAGIPETGILAQAELPQWQPYLDTWVAKARAGLENHGGYNLEETFPWSTTNWLLPPTGTSCRVSWSSPSSSPGAASPAPSGSPGAVASAAPGSSAAPVPSALPAPIAAPATPPPPSRRP